MADKKNTYIEFELEWLEKKALELKTYVDSNPFHELKDRLHNKMTSNGGVIPIVAATIEAQLKALTQALKDYAQIIAVIDSLREKEAEKAQARGSAKISGKMEEGA